MSLPFPVRLADMEAAEARYRDASAEARLAMHAELAFYGLLEDGERIILERRFPNELAGEPTADAPLGVRVAWDFRCRELVVAMLCYGDLVLAGKLDLVGAVVPQEPVEVLALTATGSMVELRRPDADGRRRWVYRPSARQDGRYREGNDVLAERVKLGNRMELGGLRTSEVLVLAAGEALPDPATIQERTGSLLFAPAKDTGASGPVPDGVRVAGTRYRVLVDAAGNASDAERPLIQKRIVALAAEIQAMLSAGGGAALHEVAALVTSSGSRYEVEVTSDGRIDLTRHSAHGQKVTLQYADAEARGQTVVKGAPLVIEHIAFAGNRVCSYIFRVAEIELR